MRFSTFSIRFSPMARPRRTGLLLLATRTLEAILVALMLGVFSALPLGLASALGGTIARTLGPLTGASRRAERHLAIAFPEKSRGELAAIVRGMWDNLGRVFAEYPHVRRIAVYGPDSPIEVVGAEHADRMRDDGEPGIFVTGHFGNWETVPPAIVQRGLPLTYFYRIPNNPMVDRMLRAMRHKEGIEQIPKGAEGARRGLRVLNERGHLGILTDLRTNEGIAIPFFGRPAMTAPAVAQLALRFGCPVCLVRAERLEGARFRITFFPPIRPRETGGRSDDIASFMAEVTAAIEGWIRERPEQWFWIHRRWGDAA
jgi:KDO2-lipid IV(A) lauroyltransferase